MLSSDDIEGGLMALAGSLPSILAHGEATTPAVLTKLDGIMGPTSLTEPFLRHWITQFASSHDITMKLNFLCKVSYATRDTIPPLSPTFSSNTYQVCRATEADIEEMIPMYVDFVAGVLHSTIPQEKAREVLRIAANRNRLWFIYYQDPNQPATPKTITSFIRVGRDTPKSIAIINAYVSPVFRKKGIAEALVRAVTRFYLGAKPLGFDYQGNELLQPKDEVCLGVIDPGAERVYIRSGFQFEGDSVDATTGRKRWFPATYFELQLVDKGEDRKDTP